MQQILALLTAQAGVSENTGPGGGGGNNGRRNNNNTNSKIPNGRHRVLVKPNI